jgi:hypothetical protein
MAAIAYAAYNQGSCLVHAVWEKCAPTRVKAITSRVREFLHSYPIVSEPLKVLAAGSGVLYGFSYHPWITTIGVASWGLYQAFNTPARVASI